jgi:hypothetical protein
MTSVVASQARRMPLITGIGPDAAGSTRSGLRFCESSRPQSHSPASTLTPGFIDSSTSNATKSLFFQSPGSRVNGFRPNEPRSTKLEHSDWENHY